MIVFRASHSGFTLVELLVSMTIFSIGLTAVYGLLWSTMKNATYSRHEVVAAGLLAEKIELLKNIRDTNVRNFLPWDNALVYVDTFHTEASLSSGTFLIENNFSFSGIEIDGTTGIIKKSNISLQKIPSLSTDTWALWEKTRLFYDDKGRYTYTPTGSGTPYGLYMLLSPLSYTLPDGTLKTVEAVPGKTDGYIIDARFIIKAWPNYYRMYDAKSIITNWIR